MRTKKEIKEKREEIIKKQKDLEHSSASVTQYTEYRGVIWALNWVLMGGEYEKSKR